MILLLLAALGCAPDPYLPAADYCEASVETFCGYYHRCGRMAVDSVEACRVAFLETCEARYEPHYVALEQTARIRLSRAGLDACADHLETVACEQQLFDLDGACGQVWEGQVPAGGDCGLGIDSFVCDASSTCVVGLDLCGTCEPTVGFGETCGDGVRCTSDAACVADVCVPRGLPGAACSEAAPCVLGARCDDGTCAGFAIAELGEACGAGVRCPYKSACVGGACEPTPLLGEACDPAVGCASGACDGAVCVALLEAGEACAGPTECVSQTCSDGVCGDLPGVCLQE